MNKLTITFRILTMVSLVLSLQACTSPDEAKKLQQVRRIKIESAKAEVDTSHRGTWVRGNGINAYPGAAVEIWVERRRKELRIDHYVIVEAKPFQEPIGGAVQANGQGEFEFNLFQQCWGGIEDATDYQIFAKDKSAGTRSENYALDKDPLKCP